MRVIFFVLGQTIELLFHFQVREYSNLFVLSGCADTPGSAADSLLKPAAICEIASAIGRSAAQGANRKEIPSEVFFQKAIDSTFSGGDIKEELPKGFTWTFRTSCQSNFNG